MCPDYDGATLIEDPSRFATQLGVDFGNAFRTGDLRTPGPTWWTAMPQVFVDHVPVLNTESPSSVIERLPNGSRGPVMPFVKRERFSDEEDYRFVISIGGSGEPREMTFGYGHH